MISADALAEVRSFGHLLSRNDYILDDHRCVVGLIFSGCRIESTLIGTSPFLIFGYDLNNIFIRQRISESEDIINTIDLGFVDNIHKKNADDEFYYFQEHELYDMRAGMFSFITTFKVQEKIKVSWNNSLFYYPNYRKPFSLRRPDPKVKKMQLNSTLLFENFFTNNMSMTSELGFLQFNGQYPRIQAGASLDFHSSNFIVKIGFSVTSTWSGFFVNAARTSRNDYQQELLRTSEGYYQTLDTEKTKYDFALHPEINIQYVF
jgi:hypothetical protein